MFRDAVSLYWDCLCSVGSGGGPGDREAKSCGLGCCLSPTLAITAHHVVEEALAEGGWVVILRGDGLFKTEFAFASREADIAVLKLTEKTRSLSGTAPGRYPTQFATNVTVGYTVGYLWRMHRTDSNGKQQLHTAFSAAEVSFISRDPDRGPGFALRAGLIADGCSGAPGFLAGGALAGVLVRPLELPSAGPSTVLRTGGTGLPRFPVLKPITSVSQKLVEMISGIA